MSQSSKIQPDAINGCNKNDEKEELGDELLAEALRAIDNFDDDDTDVMSTSTTRIHASLSESTQTAGKGTSNISLPSPSRKSTTICGEDTQDNCSSANSCLAGLGNAKTLRRIQESGLK